MTMNSSGPISLGGANVGQSINLEIGQPATSTVSLNDTIVRTLANIPTINTTITIPTDFYGKAIANSWFMTIGTPTMALPAPSSDNMGIDFDPASNLMLNFPNIWSTSSGQTIASISPSGSVNWANLFSIPGMPATTAAGNILKDASNPSNFNVLSNTRAVAPVTPASARLTILNINSSTGNLNNIQYMRSLAEPFVTAPQVNDNPTTTRGFIPVGTNFIFNQGNNRASSPPANSLTGIRALFNPSLSVVTPLWAVPAGGSPVENQSIYINKYAYTSPANTGVVIGGSTLFGSTPLGGGTVGQVFINLEQTGTINYAIRSTYYAPPNTAPSASELVGVSFNNQNTSYNKMAIVNAIFSAYSDTTTPTSSLFTNNFVVRLNKTTGAVEETVANYATPGSYPGVSTVNTYQGVTSELDNSGNLCKWVTVQPAPGAANTITKLNYFNINSPITNTYSAILSTSNGPVPTTLNIRACNIIKTYDNYNYLIIVKSAPTPSVIGILKIKSDGSNLASGLNVTAPNGFNIQLTPTSVDTLYTQTNIPFQPFSFQTSPHRLQSMGTPSVTLAPTTLSVTQNTI